MLSYVRNLVALVCVLACTTYTSPALGQDNPALVTDKDDYAPGEIAIITGSGFQPGEPVDLSISIDDPATGMHIGDYAWTIAEADANGGFAGTYLIPPEAADMVLTLTALGIESGNVATVKFTDSVVSVTLTSPTTASPVTVTSLPATINVSFTYTTGTGSATPDGHVKIRQGATDIAVSATVNLTAGVNQSVTIPVTIPSGTSNGSYDVQAHVNRPPAGGGNPAARNADQFGAVIINVATCTAPTGVSFDAVPPVSTCDTADITVTGAAASGGTAPVTFTYSIDGGAFQASNMFSAVPFGSHTICVKASNACGESTACEAFVIDLLAEPIAEVVIDSDSFDPTQVAANCQDVPVTVSASAFTMGGDPAGGTFTYYLDGVDQGGPSFSVPVGTHTIEVCATNACTPAPVCSIPSTIAVSVDTSLAVSESPASSQTLGSCTKTIKAVLTNSCGSPLDGQVVSCIRDGSIDLGPGVNTGGGVYQWTDANYAGLGLHTYEISYAGSAYYNAAPGVSSSFNAYYNYRFLPPLNNSAKSAKVKYGSTMPIKMQILDCAGNDITVATHSNGTLAGTGLAPELKLYNANGTAANGPYDFSNTNAGPNEPSRYFRFSTGSPSVWIYNLKVANPNPVFSNFFTQALANYGVKADLHDGNVSAVADSSNPKGSFNTKP